MMKRPLAIIVFLALFALVCSFNAQSIPQSVNYCNQYNNVGISVNSIAPWYCSQINQAVYNNWKSWAPIVLLAVIVSFFIAAIILIFGIAIRNEKIRNFGVSELYEASASLLIVAFFMLLAMVMFGLLPGVITGPIDPYNTSLTYIYTTINTTQTLIKTMFIPVMTDYFYTSISLSVYTGGENVIPPEIFQAFSTSIEVLFILPAMIMASLLIEGLLSLYLQFYLILFAMYAAIPVFLIPGILLRSILPLRSTGGMLIAIAISFYFILPVLFSIAYFFTNHSALQPLLNANAEINQYGAGSGAEQNAISPTSPLVLSISNLRSSMGPYWLSVLFYPALILAFVYASITTIADFIGGIPTMGSRIRMI